MPGLYDEPGAIYDDEGNYNGLSADYVERPGRFAMAPTPFDDVRNLETYNRLTLKLPGGHTRFVSVDVGGLTVVPVIGLYRADLTLRDTTPVDIYPPDWIL